MSLLLFSPLSLSPLITVSLFFNSMSLVMFHLLACFLDHLHSGHIFSFYFTFTLEPPISAIMMESLRFIPPLSDSENAFCFSSRLKADSIRSISTGYIFRGIPFIWKKSQSLDGISNFILEIFYNSSFLL